MMTEPFLVGIVVGVVFTVAICAIVFGVVLCYNLDVRVKRLESIERVQNGGD